MRLTIVCMLAGLLGMGATPSNPTFGFSAEVSLAIHDIQGAGHRSPHAGQPVTATEGVRMWKVTHLMFHTGVTFAEVIVGFAIGSLLGAIIGYLLGMSPSAELARRP